MAYLRPDARTRREFGHLIDEFVRRVQQIRTPGQVTSWWRSAGHNKAVGGSPRSQHLAGLAIDVASPRPHAMVSEARALGLSAIYHSVEGGRWHVHIQRYPAGFLRSYYAPRAGGS